MNTKDTIKMLVKKLGYNPLFDTINDLIIALSWGTWIGLLGDFVIEVAPNQYHFGNWSFNVIWDFLYLRIGGPLLFGNHVMVGIYILSIPLVFCMKEKSYKKIPMWLSCMFATVFLHELILQSFGYIAYGALVFHQIFNSYIFILGLLALPAFILGTKFQKKKLKQIAIVCIIVSITAMSLYALFDYHPMTLSQFSAGPQIFNFWANLYEIIYWVIPISIWYVPSLKVKQVK